MPRRLALILAAALALVPATAHAAVAGRDGLDGAALVYAADRAEQNRLTVSREGSRIVFDDPGATITPGEGCISVTPNRVSCEEERFVNVTLEDGDDEATSSGDVTGAPGGPEIFFDGQQGDDTLRGSADAGSLDGGTGEDVLAGGPGTSFIDAADIVWFGDFTRVPARSAAPDEISCAPPAGGEPTSIDAGEEDFEAGLSPSGPCGQVSLYRANDILIRGSEGDDELFSRLGPTRIEALGGDDTLQIDPNTRAFAGEGSDTVRGAGYAFGGPGDDRMDVGAGTTTGGTMLGQSGEDYVTGGDGRDALKGGTGRDRLSGRGGRDALRTRDGARDVVRCGRGRDRVFADREDRVARDCETVARVRTSSAAGARAADSARTTRRASCKSRARGHDVIVRSSRAVIYSRGFYLYGCLGSVRRAFRLPNEGGGYDERGAARPKLAGRYVAYASFGSAVGDEFDRLYVFDLRTGRTVIHQSSNGNISDIALRPNASVAWIGNGPVAPADGAQQQWEVRAVSVIERVGSLLLDRGTAIPHNGLALADDGETLTWTNGGEQRSAQLR